jgi:hypothetical protein
MEGRCCHVKDRLKEAETPFRFFRHLVRRPWRIPDDVDLDGANPWLTSQQPFGPAGDCIVHRTARRRQRHAKVFSQFLASFRQQKSRVSSELPRFHKREEITLLMSSSVPNSDLTNQLEILLRSFVKEKLELIMREELTNFLQVEQPNSSNSRNGYYQRSLDTRYGKIENLTVPRDREGAFHTTLFAPYQRRDGWLEEAVIKMYQSSMSTREVG